MDDLSKKKDDKIKAIWQESKERIAQNLAEKHNLLYINLKRTAIATNALALIEEKKAKMANAVAFQRIGNVLKVAVSDPHNFETIKILEELKKDNYKLIIYVATQESLSWAFGYYRFIQEKPEKISSLIEVTDVDSIEFSDLHQKLLSSPIEEVTNLVSFILKSAVLIDASDIHLEPQEEIALLRFRIDSVLYDVAEIERKKYENILQRFKLLSGLKLNITESPQSGRFTIQEKNNFFDVRVSSLPGPKGEFLVFRLLNPKRAAFGMEDLGLRGKDLKIANEFMTSPNGMIIVSGPTGSGKTTTLYSLLKAKISPGIKIITIEDPIEYQLSGVSQTQTTKNYDFQTGLKSILRQDPDVILIGEMRDKETTKTAIQASLTGHLVLTTLHANEASGTIDRLLELGAERQVLVGALKLIIAQRLLRRLCSHCKEKYQPEKKLKEQVLEAFSILSPKSEIKIPKDVSFLWRAKGCEKCHWLGYSGQIGIFEILPLSSRLAKEIVKGKISDDIRRTAIDEGMVPLFHDGLLKAIEGITSLEEVTRVAGDIDYIQNLYRELFSQTLLRGIKITPEEEEEIENIVLENKNLSLVLKDKTAFQQIAYLLASAIKSRATDLHFEAEEKETQIRKRIDGVLYQTASLDIRDHARLMNELKNLAGLKTEETQAVQEGRFKVIFPEQFFDIRLSIIPGGYGENASLRILAGEKEILDLEKLGFLKYHLDRIEEIVKKKTGLILAAGPTSSGKTTTLFAILKKINTPEVKIITIEDPIEYRLEGTIQTQIDEEKGYTFNSALKSLLRQNPNIFLVGEIRDEETAKIVWQTSLTGHLVLSTIHANDSLEVIPRLESLGIEPENIFRATNAIISQRLIRKLCPECKKEIEAPKEAGALIEKSLKYYPDYKKEIKKPYKIFTAIGCPKCSFTGYFGQTGIFEIFVPEENKKPEQIEFPRLENDAMIKVLLGITSWEEIKRIFGY